MTTDVSDTPRSDYVLGAKADPQDSGVAVVIRDLERELAAERKRADEAEKDAAKIRAAAIEDVRERIKAEYIDTCSEEYMGYRQGYNECVYVLYDELKLLAAAKEPK